MKMIIIIISVLELIINKLQPTSADYEFGVQLHSYSNPSSRDSLGDSCEGPFCIFSCECDTKFTFCLRPSGSLQDNNPSNCPLGVFKTRVFEEQNNINFTQITNLGDNITPLSNPFFYRDSGNWPGRFQLYVQVVDIDLTIITVDVIDNIYIDMALTPSPSFTTPQTFVGNSSNGRLEMSFRVQCTNGSSGNTCQILLPTTSTPPPEVSSTPPPITSEVSSTPPPTTSEVSSTSPPTTSEVSSTPPPTTSELSSTPLPTTSEVSSTPPPNTEVSSTSRVPNTSEDQLTTPTTTSENRLATSTTTPKDSDSEGLLLAVIVVGGVVVVGVVVLVLVTGVFLVHCFKSHMSQPKKRDEETYDNSNEGMKMNAMEEDPYCYPDNIASPPSINIKQS